MTAYLLTIHLLNALAPAAVLALLMTWLAPRWPFLRGAKAWVRDGRARFAWSLAANGLVVLAGMWLGATGKVSVYAALVLVSALTQCLLLGLWRS